MSAEYAVYLTDEWGDRIATLDGYTSLTWTRRVNDIGQLRMAFGPGNFDATWWGLDRRVQVWRKATGGAFRLCRVYLLRWRDRGYDEEGRYVQMIGGPDLNDYLRRRQVAYPAGSSQASKNTYADDLLAALARENLANLAISGRDITGLGFSVYDTFSSVAVVSKGCSWRNLLTVLQEVCATIREEHGTSLYFDIVEYPRPTALQFRVYWGQRGSDRVVGYGGSQQIFSVERGNLAEPRLVEDWTEEVNYIYGAGQGLEAERTIVEVQDAARVALTRNNRCEATFEGAGYATTGHLTSAARARLAEGRPVIAFTAKVPDVEESRFQRDWDYGDRVTAEFEGERFECEIMAVRANVADGRETVEARIEYAG